MRAPKKYLIILISFLCLTSLTGLTSYNNTVSGVIQGIENIQFFNNFESYSKAEPQLIAERHYEVEVNPMKCIGTWGSAYLEWSGGVVTDGNDFYITGTRSHGEDFIVVLMKVSSDCEVEWVKGWKPEEEMHGVGGTHIAAKDGFLLISGYDLLLKFTKDGDLIWSKKIAGGPEFWEAGFQDMASIGDDIYIATHHGGLVKATEREGSLTVDWVLAGVGYSVETYGGFIYVIGGEMMKSSKIVKLTDDGQILWSKDLGEDVSDLAVSEYGVYAVAGNKVIKLSHEGNFIWATELTLNTMHDLHLTGILVDPTSIYVYGYESKSLGHQRAVATVMDEEGNFVAGYAINTPDWQQDKSSLDEFVDAVGTDNLVFLLGDVWDEVEGVDELAGLSRHITVNLRDENPDIQRLEGDFKFLDIAGEITTLTGSSSYSGASDILFAIMRNPNRPSVKFRGMIIDDLPIVSFYSIGIRVDEILSDPTGKLRIGDVVRVWSHRDGPAQIDNYAVGDRVEVFGKYFGEDVRAGISGIYIDLETSDHYLTVIEELTTVTIISTTTVMVYETYTSSVYRSETVWTTVTKYVAETVYKTIESWTTTTITHYSSKTYTTTTTTAITQSVAITGFCASLLAILSKICKRWRK